MGSRLISRLATRGHPMRALVRPASQHRIPAGCTPVSGDALDAASYTAQVLPAEAFVHLVGVAHPSPAKAEQFRTVDLASARAAVIAARSAGIAHFIYVSVAHPAPVMKAYIAARSRGGGPDPSLGLERHHPAAVVCARTRPSVAARPRAALLARRTVLQDAESARRLGLVTIDQMMTALAWAVENPPAGVRVMEVPAIRAVATGQRA